nr:MAG TPA: hypothetical protein [Caudoviricetes sp.]
MGYRTHSKWPDSPFISPTLEGCLPFFIPSAHIKRCGNDSKRSRA